MVGNIKKCNCLRVHRGSGKTATGIEFKLAQTAGNFCPMVIVNKKAFILTWEDILNLAKDAGLFNEIEKGAIN